MARYTFREYWPTHHAYAANEPYWAVYMDGALLDVYPDRSLAEGYCNYMNGRASV